MLESLVFLVFWSLGCWKAKLSYGFGAWGVGKLSFPCGLEPGVLKRIVFLRCLSLGWWKASLFFGFGPWGGQKLSFLCVLEPGVLKI